MEMVPAMGMSIHAKDACTIMAYIRTTDAVITYSTRNNADHAHPEKTAQWNVLSPAKQIWSWENTGMMDMFGGNTVQNK